MYQFLLTKRYLVSKIMPLLAAVAVILCTAMVLVVWSVMNGFLTMLIGSGRTMTGDVAVSWPNAGFAHYQELIDDLRKEPLVAGAAPVIESFGLIALPDGAKKTVRVRGIEGASYSQVTRYEEILHWRPIAEPVEKDEDREDPRLHSISGTSWPEVLDNGLRLVRKGPSGSLEPAMVMGIEVSEFNRRQIGGYYVPQQAYQALPNGDYAFVDLFMPRDGKVLLSLAPLDASGRAVEMVSRNLAVANEFQSGVFDVDSSLVLIPLEVAQDMLRMNASKRVVRDPKAPAAASDGFDDPAERVVEDPSRVTDVLVRGSMDVFRTQDAMLLRAAVERVYERFAERHKGTVPPVHSINILTWEQQNRTMISAVKKETVLLLVLFMIISVVAVFLILAIFWSMVAEKTKDIGVLRAVGASSAGVAGLWVSYGLAIGVVGSTLGLGLAWTIVTNINPIHEWLGRAMGIVIWDPRIYYFVTIPNKVETDKAIIVFVAGVLSSTIGALVPAARAALMHPVRALRFE
ncbi:MAG: FtsX-like permease family protein [Phycisphaerales bacterium]|jgi:lipoprotein-releasing system permease protein